MKLQKLTGGYELLWHPHVLEYYNNIINGYTPPKGKEIALFLPCTATKPYSNSRTHRKIHKILNCLNGSNRIHELIVGEPLALVPMELETMYPAAHYDMVLDSWFPIKELPNLRKKRIGNDIVAARYGIKSNPPTKIVNELADRVSEFLDKKGGYYKKHIAFVRGTHRQIIEKAVKRSGVMVEIIPSKKDIQNIISEKSTFFWIMNGMRCNESLKFLKSRLLETLLEIK